MPKVCHVLFVVGWASSRLQSGHVWDEKRIQMMTSSNHLSLLDPYKTDTDDFQQSQSIGSKIRPVLDTVMDELRRA
jgi:hypothetical protein